MSTQEHDTKVLEYLDTMRRVPDDVILRVATRDMEMNSGETCFVGWVVREQLAALTDRPAEDIAAIYWGNQTERDVIAPYFSPQERATFLFGGRQEEWTAIYGGVEDLGTLIPIEIAFTIRVDEAVKGKSV